MNYQINALTTPGNSTLERQRATLISIPLAVLLAVLVIACGGMPVEGVALRSPRWACPSPTPLPYGTAGPVKEIIHHTGTITEGGDWDEPVYFAEWEQEYGALGGPPFPAPTPYAIQGTSYTFGQRVEVWPFHVTVAAQAGAPVVYPGIPPGTQQLYTITLEWVNHATEPVPFVYAHRIRLRSITDPQGRMVSDNTWGMHALALELSGQPAPADLIPPGVSRVVIPVIAPPGSPKVVDITFAGNSAAAISLPTVTPTPGAPDTTPALPTATLPPTTTPVGNTQLRSAINTAVVVSWSDAALAVPGAPPCNDPGALTDWGGRGAWGEPIAVDGIAAPAGTDRVVQIALNQVGKPYIWGAKGPEAFDCSGLLSWSYAQIGISIPNGTAGQWPAMAVVDPQELQPGDLIFLAIEGGGIDHVGMLTGDIDGDGQWDMVHAANPKLGVRTETNIFASAYYTSRIRGFRTARYP